jgi:uncharacterized protein involved in exopolysaccharide biosynthesis
MNRPPSLIDWVLDRPWFRDANRRRLTFLAVALVAGVLAVFPRPYTAEAQLMPQEASGGLSSVLASEASGALLNLSVLTGSRTSIEEDVTISRGHEVMQEAIAKLHLVGKPGYPDAATAEAKLSHKVSIIAIRGAIIQVQATDHDREFVQAFVGAIASAVQQRLAEISLKQAAEKREVTANRLQDASIRLAKAQDALNQYRLQKRLPAPELQLGTGVSNLAALQAQLAAKEVELKSLAEVATPNNIQMKVVQADIDSLKAEIAESQKTSGSALANVAVANTEYYDRVRDVTVAQLLYQVYSRYLDELTIDEMSAGQNVELIQPAFVNPRRQYNLAFVGILCLVIGLGVGAEYYMVGNRPRRPSHQTNDPT